MIEKGTLLIVDDTPESLVFLSVLLSGEGYKVYPADSGELALAFISVNAPDVILLDIRMPGMNGFEVCRRLKSQESTRAIPILFLSAYSEENERIEGLRLGAVDFISKPFRNEEMLARVQTHVELSRLRTRLERLVDDRTDQLRLANERLEIELGERKQAEEQVRGALAEKEVLLRELHHRTKNSLHIITSMIAIQEAHLANPNLESIFQDIRSRVSAMAMVHEKLYLSQDLARIDLAQYIRDLSEMLISSYQVVGEGIELVIRTEPVVVTVETAIPCSLIVNELITNALKYAFPDHKGRIQVSLEKEGTSVLLTIGDNGVGYSGDFDPDISGNMGLQLIRLLGNHQLNGVVIFQSDPGFSCQVRFPLPE